MKTAIDRFMKYVDKTSDSCWLWTGGTNTKYGVFRVGSLTDGSRKSTYAHRFSYEYHKGPIPGGLFVCHTCDVKLCVNPEHLFLGSNADNINDHLAKGKKVGRPLNGEENGRRVLCEEDVLSIRQMSADGESLAKLARRFGVTKQTIWGIVKRKNWTHI